LDGFCNLGAFLGTFYVNRYMPAIFDEPPVFKRHFIVKLVTSHLSHENKPGFLPGERGFYYTVMYRDYDKR